MTIKDQLLNPGAGPRVPIHILGADYDICRLSAARMASYSKTISQLAEKEDSSGLNTQAAELILESIIDEQDQPLSQSIEPSALVERYSAADLQVAIRQLMKVNYMTEEAEQTAKNG